MDTLLYQLSDIYRALLLRVTIHEFAQLSRPRLIILMGFYLIFINFVRVFLQNIVVVDSEPGPFVLLDKFEESLSGQHLLILEVGGLTKDSWGTSVDIDVFFRFELVSLHQLMLHSEKSHHIIFHKEIRVGNILAPEE